MTQDQLENINRLINDKKIDQAQFELSKLGPEFLKNTKYLYLRSKIFYINKLYYISIDTLLIALEFEESEEVYKLISKIYKVLGNEFLSKQISNPDSRFKAIQSLKSELTGISQKGYDI